MCAGSRTAEQMAAVRLDWESGRLQADWAVPVSSVRRLTCLHGFLKTGETRRHRREDISEKQEEKKGQ